MRLPTRFLVVVLVVAGFAGAGSAAFATNQAADAQGQESSDHIGIIDVVKVADALGWTDRMKSGMAQLQAQLKDDVKNVRAQVKGNLDEQLHKYGMKAGDSPENLTPEQKQRYTQLQSQLPQVESKLNEAIQQLQKQYAAEWDKQYARALLPEIRKVAAGKHLIAVLNSQQVIWHDAAVDITDAVVDVANADRVAPVDVPMPGHISLDATKLFAPAEKPGEPK